MIQINLLPEVKAEYVKAQRVKRTVVVSAMMVSAVSIGVVVLLAGVALGSQALQLNGAEDKINDNVAKLNEVNDLDKVLTIQNQLFSVAPLHNDKPVASRVFTYLQQTTPEDVRIDTYTIDYEQSTMTIEGNTESIELINKYVDTVKFTEIKVTEEGVEPPRAFSDVVLVDFSKDDEEATFSISFAFDPSLFLSANEDIEIVVPKLTTTRSETEKPGALFVPNNDTEVE